MSEDEEIEAALQAAFRASPQAVHSAAAYRRGCRCPACSLAWSDYQREYRERQATGRCGVR